MSAPIIFLIFYLILGLIIFFGGLFNKKSKTELLGISFFFLGSAFFNLICYLYFSELIFITGNIMLFGLLILFISALTTVKINRCTVKVQAKIIGRGTTQSYRMPFGRRKEIVHPKYSYRHESKNYESVGIEEYSESFYDLISKEDTVEIFIDPNKPFVCTDKKYRSHKERTGIIAGVIMVIFAIIIYLIADK